MCYKVMMIFVRSGAFPSQNSYVKNGQKYEEKTHSFWTIKNIL